MRQLWSVSDAALCKLLHTSLRGIALVEFALALPVIILLLTALADFGLGFYQGLQVQGAAAAGAQYATLHKWDRSAIKEKVETAGNGIEAVPLPVQVCACPIGSAGASGNDLRVVANPAPGSGPTTEGNCIGNGVPTCADCTTSTGATCPAGLYASVGAQLTYSPLLPYPGLLPSFPLTGHAYRRLK
jgi:Flp pilus assembly protein TadG